MPRPSSTVAVVAAKRTNAYGKITPLAAAEGTETPCDRPVEVTERGHVGLHDEANPPESPFLDLSTIEPFVKPQKVGEYVGLDAATVVRFAARGILPGHPIRESGKRCHWRFLLSEVREVMLSKTTEKKRATVRAEAQSKAKLGKSIDILTYHTNTDVLRAFKKGKK